jgi:membrane-associated PAP2 superfamily phosphatase
MLDHVIAGWLTLMWLIVSTLWAMRCAYIRARDEELMSILWAIVFSVLGFLISMNLMNAFHNLTIQNFFWSLIGIGGTILFGGLGLEAIRASEPGEICEPFTQSPPTVSDRQLSITD